MARGRRLSGQQKARIRARQQKRQRSLDAEEMETSETDLGDPLAGQVVVRHGKQCLIADEQYQLTDCAIRANIGQPVCGDHVVWHRSESHGVVSAILPRRSLLARPDYSGRKKPLAANLDRLIIVIAPRPEPSPYLIDQYLITAEVIGLQAVIALNKIDLLDDQTQTFVDGLDHYATIGYPLIHISARQARGLEPLEQHLKEGCSILVGQSGVGKSSLLNALLPDREVQIGRLSDATGLGRHTTSAATLYELPENGQLIDSPGVRSFRLSELSREQLEQGFREFAPFLGNCRFSNCHHHQEPDCALKQAVEEGKIHPDRLENFRHMLERIG
jgi:ribosome biogenesis GTPase